MGQSRNSVNNAFWAVNIPGTWNELTPEKAKIIKEGTTSVKLVHIGKNDFGRTGFGPVCPEGGIHRYRLTLWALDGYVSSGDYPLAEDVDYRTVKAKLDELKIVKFVEYVKVLGNSGPSPGNSAGLREA